MAAYRELRTEERRRIEAGQSPTLWIPDWTIAALSLAPTPPGRSDDLDVLDVLVFLVGASAVLALTPRAWWSDPMELIGSAAIARGYLGIGLVGAVVFGVADLVGYGYPGLGVVQIVGLTAMPLVALLGMTDLVRCRGVRS